MKFTSNETESVKKQQQQQTEVQNKMASQVNSTNIQKRITTYPSQTITQKKKKRNCIGRITSKFILQGQNHLGTKSLQMSHKKVNYRAISLRKRCNNSTTH